MTSNASTVAPLVGGIVSMMTGPVERPLLFLDVDGTGRPFIWVDDEITDADQAWVLVHHTGPALLHRVESGPGLTDADFAAIGHWLANLTGPSAGL
jgi:hypothetical protein